MLRFLILVILAIGTCGCGGGGGGESVSTTPATPETPSDPNLITLGTVTFNITNSQDFSTHPLGQLSDSLIFSYKINNGGVTSTTFSQFDTYSKVTKRGVPCWLKTSVVMGTTNLAYYAKSIAGDICLIQLGSNEFSPWTWLPASLAVGASWTADQPHTISSTDYQVLEVNATSPSGRTGCIKIQVITHDTATGAPISNSRYFLKPGFGCLIIDQGDTLADSIYLDTVSG